MNKLNYKDNSTYYYDSRMMQVFHIPLLLEKLVQNKKNTKAIEIGTAYGGFTNLLADYFNSVFTFDIKDYKPNFYKHKNITFTLCDIHSFKDIINNLVPVIQQEGNNVIFVDGGDKALEMNLIADFLKPNDLIMCHDFSINENDFEQRGKIIWNWLECKESDLDLNKLKRSSFFDFGLYFGWGIYEKNN